MEACAATSKRYVLIDYENVQPQDLAPLDGQAAKVVVFLGANQTKIRADFAVALQARGCHGLYVRWRTAPLSSAWACRSASA
jgi:hypothetical protein